MTTESLTLDIQELTLDEASQIWKRQTKRAPNFNEFVTALRMRDVGATFRTKVPAGDKNAEYAKEIRRNFNEAAKERTAFVVVDVQSPPADAKPGATIKATDGRDVTLGDDGKWRVEKLAPVVLRWKTNSHSEKRKVEKDGKKAEIDVQIIDSLDALIVASDAVQHRAPRKVTEDVTALVAIPPVGAKKGATVQIPDGRTATLTAAGKWRAPKVETPNGTAGNVGPSAAPTATPAVA